MDCATDQMAGAAPVVLPLIRGAEWFGPDPGPFVLRMEVPLTFEEMVAALYVAAEPDEIASNAGLCGSVAVALLIEGLPALDARAARLAGDELRGAVESAEFLALCRRRVAALLAQ